jgi:predicted O-linked N-acetylglucosamine transferase (SPINDLY family)
MCDLQLGLALHNAGRRAEALSHDQAAAAAHPTTLPCASTTAPSSSRNATSTARLKRSGTAVRLTPQDATPLNNLAVVMKEVGDIGEATRLLRRCVDLKPSSLEIRSNLILTLHYDPQASSADLASAHEDWNRLHPRPARAHANTPEPGRRLRLGFVSPDLRDHVVGRALLPSFRRFDPERFELYCYANPVADAVGEEFRSRSQGWRELGAQTAAQLADAVAADGIDILIDLALHTSDNRLDVFALKPAPLQVSWLGYPERLRSGHDGLPPHGRLARTSVRQRARPPAGESLADSRLLDVL